MVASLLFSFLLSFFLFSFALFFAFISHHASLKTHTHTHTHTHTKQYRQQRLSATLPLFLPNKEDLGASRLRLCLLISPFVPSEGEATALHAAASFPREPLLGDPNVVATPFTAWVTIEQAMHLESPVAATG